jgi:regulator of protease activity HflC (stomatin/prohibitin superfamily)
VHRSYYVRIPEGANALLSRGGRYTRTLESGPHFVQPWFAITHLVTRRQIPFLVPVTEAPTKENVRANLETLITFTISDPYRFVYSISADDFDEVLQATCQDTLRSMIRGVTTDEVNDLVRADLAELQQSLSAEVEPYGISITKINILFAQPPVEFLQSQEARQLAALQQAEQAEKQALAMRQQQDAAELARQEVIARVEREREQLQLTVQQAEARRRVFELEAEAEALRMAKLQARLEQFPEAMNWEWQGEQLGVVQALAGNSRVVIQASDADALVRAMVLRDMASPADAPDATTNVAATK